MGLDDHIYLSIPSPAWERAWQITETLVSQLKIDVEGKGARFIVVTLTNSGQVFPRLEDTRRYEDRLGEKDLFYPERRMKKLANKRRIELITLAQPFQEYAQKHNVWLHGFPNTGYGGHWNENGHTLAAELIAKYLCVPTTFLPP